MKKLIVLSAVCVNGTAGAMQFEKPLRLTAGGEPIKVEAPGYAAPCLASVDGDGKKGLVAAVNRESSALSRSGRIETLPFMRRLWHGVVV